MVFFKVYYKIRKSKFWIKKVFLYYNNFINVEFYMLSCNIGINYYLGYVYFFLKYG